MRQYVLDLSSKLSYEKLRIGFVPTLGEQLVTILDRHVKKLQNRDVPLLLIQWSQRGVEIVTGGTENIICLGYSEVHASLVPELI